MNAQAIQFAKESGILIYARSTFKSGAETVIKTINTGNEKGITAIVHENDVVRVILSFPYLSGDFNELLIFLESKQVSIKELNLTEAINNNIDSKASFVVAYKNIYGWEKIKDILEEKYKENIEFDYNLSALSIIGEGLSRENQILIDTIELLKKEKIKIYGITTTSYRLSFLVDKSILEKSVKLLHKKWIEKSESK